MGRHSENLNSRISLLIYPEWRAHLEMLCRERGATLSGLLRQIIAQALDEDGAALTINREIWSGHKAHK